jgi:hypothetical protein
MGNEAYIVTSLLQLLMYIVTPAVYEIIYEALGIHVMHRSMYMKHASTDLCRRNETALISKQLMQLSAIKIFQHKYLNIQRHTRKEVPVNETLTPTNERMSYLF